MNPSEAVSEDTYPLTFNIIEHFEVLFKGVNENIFNKMHFRTFAQLLMSTFGQYDNASKLYSSESFYYCKYITQSY